MAFRRDGRIRTLPPAHDVPEDSDDYPQKWLTAPAMTGTPLRLFVALAESPLFGPVRRKLMAGNGLPQVLEEVFIPEEPAFEANTHGWPEEKAGPGRLAPLAAASAAGGSGGGGTESSGGGGDGELSAAQRAAAAFQLLGCQAAAPAAGTAAGGATADGPASGGSGGGSGGSAARRHHRVADFHAAYASGALTPSDVAENVIAAVAASEAQSPPMRFFVAHDPAHLRAAAAESTKRWAAGRPLSPLDGVPFAVKDCVDALPYPTTSGTGFMADWRKVTHSLAGVQALLDAGALLVGKATLHEIGLGTTGLNTVTGTARNPHSPAHHTGGSSSGSAALVAAGICPFAVGTDGGGSIRIPSAACGVVGLKPTHDRIGCVVGVPPIDCSVAVVGPIASCAQDAALAYAVMANTGQPAHSPPPPPVLLPAALEGGGSGGGKPLAGLRAGVCWKWFDDAEPVVAAACRSAVERLQAAGLELVELQIPELGLLQPAHSCIIASEMRNSMNGALHDTASRRVMNAETRVSLAVAAGFTSAAYINAARIRARLEAHFRRAFSRCDFLLTPSLPCTAPPIKPAALAHGETDLTTTTSLMRYMQAANFIGIPAISIPVGIVPSTHGTTGAAPPGSSGGAQQLPVGLQVMAPCWHEAGLLHVAAVLEAASADVQLAMPVPAVWYNVLKPVNA